MKIDIDDKQQWWTVEESEGDEEDAEIVREYLKNHPDFRRSCERGWRGSLDELKVLCVLLKHNANPSILIISGELLKKGK